MFRHSPGGGGREGHSFSEIVLVADVPHPTVEVTCSCENITFAPFAMGYITVIDPETILNIYI